MKTLALALVISFGSLKAQQKTDFSGTWTINMKKSDLGKVDINAAAAIRVIIEQKPNALLLGRTFKNARQANENYNFDGTAVDTVMGVYKRSSFFKWSDEQNRFTIASVYKVTPVGTSPWQYTRTEVYSLSEDGKLLTIERVSAMPDRIETIRAVYDKK